ncbi:glucokinase [Sphingomonas tabacisoli]|uniref:Glucokinase n=1 Tax=Sphingomonas tabacisoli TaxID=2249466 RepID=A0ABW4I462_9SPHN
MDLIAIDIGGTHARFAPARVEQSGVSLGPETVLKTGDYSGLAEAWKAFARQSGGALPSAVSIAIAAPVTGHAIKLTNNKWVLRPAELAHELGVDRAILINDFAAVAHAVSVCGNADLRYICGPEVPLPREGVISIVGPGTGLGVAMLLREAAGDRVIATEGGHVCFAPGDELEDRLLGRLRTRFGRVSLERVICGVGLTEIHAVITGDDARVDDRALWQSALSGTDESAVQTLDRYCEILGAAAGDFALAQGAAGVVIAGGLGLRLADRLPSSGFGRRFRNKGRFERLMDALPVKLITHPQPGLLGAAAAFAAQHRA